MPPLQQKTTLLSGAAPLQPVKNHTGNGILKLFCREYPDKKPHQKLFSKIVCRNTKSRRTGFLPRRREKIQ